ncbi:MAG: putative zinc-binding metallopeptidase [Solirubrobacteraceae bacterium]
MRVFACPTCHRLVTFESVVCLNCSTELAFDHGPREIVASQERCANAAIAACNWLAAVPGGLCAACVLTRTRPADSDAVGMAAFPAAEAAKRRLLFELGELGLAWDGLTFDLLSSAFEPVTTGHADGVVTLDLAEADPASREQRRTELDEPYRTVLGHLRHEVGHYYQDVLVAEDTADREEMRELFGDERASYQEAIDHHYASGPPEDWREHFVSAYATMHPWEDWAETFAHYLHIRDALQTAASHGLRVEGPDIEVADEAPLHADPVEEGSIQTLLRAWLPLTYALNAMSRSLGSRDVYPFVISRSVMAKLGFVHRFMGS